MLFLPQTTKLPQRQDIIVMEEFQLQELLTEFHWSFLAHSLVLPLSVILALSLSSFLHYFPPVNIIY